MLFNMLYFYEAVIAHKIFKSFVPGKFLVEYTTILLSNNRSRKRRSSFQPLPIIQMQHLTISNEHLQKKCGSNLQEEIEEHL